MAQQLREIVEEWIVATRVKHQTGALLGQFSDIPLHEYEDSENEEHVSCVQNAPLTSAASVMNEKSTTITYDLSEVTEEKIVPLKAVRQTGYQEDRDWSA